MEMKQTCETIVMNSNTGKCTVEWICAKMLKDIGVDKIVETRAVLYI